MKIENKNDFEIVPCLQQGPLAEKGSAFVNAAQKLGSMTSAAIIRTWCVPYLFTTMEHLLKSGEHPVDGVNAALDSLTKFLVKAETANLGIIDNDNLNTEDNTIDLKDVKEITGEHYGHLFKAFSTQSYWDEPVKLLGQRLERNGLSLFEIKNKKTLDAGCGGGRYSVAWRLLGASPVVGLDVSDINIENANRQSREGGIDNISFEKGDVLKLPFAENEFDIVFSNGVLHHTTDWQQGVKEMIRVLKPGGLGWLYLIEKPGGVFWDVIEILRVVMKNEKKSSARMALQMINMPASRIFYILDHVMVPINIRLYPQEIEEVLATSGATNIKRLKRGADFDRVEHIFQKNKYADLNFGVGENRYVFSK